MTSVIPPSRVRFTINDLGINQAILTDLAAINKQLHELRFTGAPEPHERTFKSQGFANAEAQFHLSRTLGDYVRRYEKSPEKMVDNGSSLIDASKSAGLTPAVAGQFKDFPKNSRAALDALVAGNNVIDLFARRQSLMQNKVQFSAKSTLALGHLCDRVVVEIYSDTALAAQAANKKTLTSELVPASSNSLLRPLYANLPRFQALLAREARRRACTTKTFDDDEVAAGFATKTEKGYTWPAIDDSVDNSKTSFKSFIKKLIRNYPNKGSFNMSNALNMFLSALLLDLVSSFVQPLQVLNARTNNRFKNVTEQTVALIVQLRLGCSASVVDDLITNPVPQVEAPKEAKEAKSADAPKETKAPKEKKQEAKAEVKAEVKEVKAEVQKKSRGKKEAEAPAQTSAPAPAQTPAAAPAQTKKSRGKKEAETPAQTPAPTTAPAAENKRNSRGGKKA